MAVRCPSYYFVSCDRSGHWLFHKTARWISADRVWRQYRRHGYGVNGWADVGAVPAPLKEAVASSLRKPWRCWLFAEMAVSAAAGPAGNLISLASVVFVLAAWSVEMGYAYGLDMTDPQRQDRLRAIIGRGMSRMILGERGQTAGWQRVGRGVSQVFLLGFGQDLLWADRIMAHVRQIWRQEAGLGGQPVQPSPKSQEGGKEDRNGQDHADLHVVSPRDMDASPI